MRLRNMFSFLFVAVLMMLAAVAVTNTVEAQRSYYGPPQIIKVTKQGPYAVTVVCLNGADPTGHMASNILIVSCAEETKK
jgi:hypothetical protein